MRVTDYSKISKDAGEHNLSKCLHETFMRVKEQGFKMMGNEHIVMFLYPGMNSLDLVAPQYLFAIHDGCENLFDLVE